MKRANHVEFGMTPLILTHQMPFSVPRTHYLPVSSSKSIKFRGRAALVDWIKLYCAELWLRSLYSILFSINWNGFMHQFLDSKLKTLKYHFMLHFLSKNVRRSFMVYWNLQNHREKKCLIDFDLHSAFTSGNLR